MSADKKLYAVKEVVFPWKRFPEVDPILGPEMRSTGEVMAIDEEFGMAYYKAQLAAGQRLPTKGKVFISVADRDKSKIVDLAKGFKALGFELCATAGTYRFLREHGIEATHVLKVSEGRPHVVDMITNGDINLVINTPTGKKERSDAYYIRRAVLQYDAPYTTTVRGGYAMLSAIECFLSHGGKLRVYAIQDIHK